MKGYFGLWAIFGVVVAVSTCQPSRAVLTDWIYWLLFIVSIVVAPLLFAFLSVPVSFIVLVPLYYLGDRLAGAPFRVGDHVKILVGPPCGRIVEIYDVWDSRRQIRVGLDPESEKDVRDVFSFTQVCREKSAV